MKQEPFPEPKNRLHRIPGYWPNETSGVLRPVVEAYLSGRELSPAHVSVMRSYLRQWTTAPGWAIDADDLEKLVGSLESVRSTTDVRRWLAAALDLGIDPL